MKRFVIASLFSTALIGAYAATFTDNARVHSAEPMTENISIPHEECRQQWVQERGLRTGGERQDRPYGGAIVGGLAGGVIGHQFGAGSGKDAATALGVVLGAITGDQMENRDQRGRYDDRSVPTGRREVQSCRTVYTPQTRITGYRVAYEYRGQQYTTVMPGNPGRNLLVRVTVDPIEQ